MVLRYQDIPRRITGFSSPVFGLNWQVPQDDRATVRRLLIFLEDRRALFDLYDREVQEAVTASVQVIRREITTTLQALNEGAEASMWLQGMQAACRRFLGDTQGVEAYDDEFPWPRRHHPDRPCHVKLGRRVSTR
jgi:hypothetical protein